MPRIIDTETGQEYVVSDAEATDLVKSGDFAFAGGERVAVAKPGDVQAAVDPRTQAGARALTGSEAARAARAYDVEAAYGGEGGRTFLEGLASGATLGLSDLVQRVGSAEDPLERRAIRGRAEANEGLRTAGEITGTVAPALLGGGLGATPAGAATRLGARLAARGGETLGGRLAAGAAAGAAEGALLGLGEGTRRLALDEEPITAERALSTLSSQALYGGLTGGVTGAATSLLGRAAEKALARGRRKLDEIAARPQAAEDLASLDRKGLRAAREEELARIEAERAVDRQGIADELLAWRAAAKEGKPWLATADKEARKVALRADRQLDRLIDNPKGLAQNPRRALDSLQRSETALGKIVGKADELAAQLAGEGRQAGARAQAMEAAKSLLERNRALQARIEASYAAPASTRLTAVEDALDAAVNQPGKSLPRRLLEGGTYSAVTSAAAPLGPLAPILGAKAAEVIGQLSVARLAKASQETLRRVGDALEGAVSAAKKTGRAAPLTATAVLRRASFGDASSTAQPSPRAPLGDLFRARESELRALAPGGTMAPEARRELGARLASVRQVAPVLADRMETAAARRVEFLASKLPARPDYTAVRAGPDTWRPSDFEIRQFARYVAAAEDPAGVMERVADGSLTPEDAEALRAVYPSLYDDARQALLERLPQLTESLPYERRLMLSILLGVPVDPAMRPEILQVLQGSYDAEPGTQGGTAPPVARPQFGSLSKAAVTPTAAQERAG